MSQIENMDDFQSNASCQGLDADLEDKCICDPLESCDTCIHRMQEREQCTAAHYRTFLHLNHLDNPASHHTTDQHPHTWSHHTSVRDGHTSLGCCILPHHCYLHSPYLHHTRTGQRYTCEILCYMLSPYLCIFLYSCYDFHHFHQHSL